MTFFVLQNKQVPNPNLRYVKCLYLSEKWSLTSHAQMKVVKEKKSKQLHSVNVIRVIGCNLDKVQPLLNAVNSMDHTIQPLLSLIGECKHCS